MISKLGHRKIVNLLTMFFIGLSLLSLWLYSRFTVDDAFISWRYGRNLVNFGIWNYNPSNQDLTQSYTSPIFALLSIIPAYFDIDIVLFFKILSILFLSFFTVFLLKSANFKMIEIALIFAIPQTFIHLFSGLETFYFAAFLGLLFYYLSNNELTKASLIIALLTLIRPEAFLLALLFTIYLLVDYYSVSCENCHKDSIRPNSKTKYVLLAIMVFLPIIIMFTFNGYHFGFLLPNTFYVKSPNEFDVVFIIQSVIEFLKTIYILFPLIITILLSMFFKKKVDNVLIYAFIFIFSVLAYYSISELTMNYADRFYYHLLLPQFIIIIKTSSNFIDEYIIIKNSNLQLKLNLASSLKFLNSITVIFFVIMNFSGQYINLIDYYPRLLDSFGSLGLAIKEDGVNNIAIGDAGILPLVSDSNNLDFIGLGSSEVAHNGLNEKSFNLYKQHLYRKCY